MTKAVKRYSENELYAMIEKRFDTTPREWALFPQVRNGSGFSATRTADAIALNLWPSRGHEMHGFEIKSARSDWLREVKNPRKLDETMEYCDRIWIVAAPDVVKASELPAGWGWLCPVGTVEKSGLRAKVVAVKNREAKALTRSAVAALLMRAHEALPGARALADANREGYDRGHKVGESTRNWEHRRTRDDHAELLKDVAKFEKVSGVKIRDRWDLPDIGEAVRIAVKLVREKDAWEMLRRSADRLEQLAESLREAAEAVNVVMKGVG